MDWTYGTAGSPGRERDRLGDLRLAGVRAKPDRDHLAEALSLFACLAFATVIIVVTWWKDGLAWHLG